VVLTAAEQVARHLRDELLRGVWSGVMPGGDRLAAELGIGRDTVEAALKQLEAEGLLMNQGRRRGRRIAVREGANGVKRLRLGILPYDAADRGLPYLIDLQYRLEEAGHVVVFMQKTLMDLQRDVKRVAALVGRHEMDAWVVLGGPLEVTEWFAAQPMPAFALFGRRRSVPIAGGGPDKVPAVRDVVRRLCGLGHRRIVFFVRGERRKPQPGEQELAFLEELAAHGISTGPYHLPDWEETPEGFLRCLEGLFSMTPPSALIFDETFLFAAAQQHFAQRGMLAPRDISLVCCDPPETALAWMRPSMSHIRWDHRPVVSGVMRWAANVGRGRKDLRQTLIPAEFIPGGTIGPAKAEK
jgi:DNA-binding LacI/PurR family transcriptional regulator/biotin operon repressor